jgi:antitoxin component YwqK of YwqJK toxin-antitoxin module
MEEGEWKFYDEAGRLRYEGHYSRGKRTGTWYTFTKKGQRAVWKYKD